MGDTSHSGGDCPVIICRPIYKSCLGTSTWQSPRVLSNEYTNTQMDSRYPRLGPSGLNDLLMSPHGRINPRLSLSRYSTDAGKRAAVWPTEDKVEQVH